MEGDKVTAIDLAMHAVAACCRRCAEYWHGIPLGVELADTDLTYLGTLAWRFLEARLAGVSGWPQTGMRMSNGEAQIHTLLRPPATVISRSSTLKAS